MTQPSPATTAPRTDYLPGMGHHGSLALYDPLTRLLGIPAVHRQLIEQAQLRPGHRVLEVGCGTGNLAILATRMEPDAEILGIDPDPRALARARRKADRAGLRVGLDRGFAERLPYPDATFDRVLSAFMFHHVAPADKPTMLREIARVLRPAGSLHLVDFGETHHRSGGLIARFSRRSKRLRDNFGDRIPTLMREAGLAEVTEMAHRVAFLGPVTSYRATP